MESSIKSLIITGSAVDDAKPRQGSRRRRKIQANTNEENDSEFLEKAKQYVVSKSNTVDQVKPAVRIQIPDNPVILLPPPVKEKELPVLSVAKPIEIHEVKKVILQPPKQHRVKLQPKVAAQPPRTHINHSTRRARRVTVANLNHRFTRAKRLKDDTDKKTIDTIREYLVQRGVIQEKSRAPEKMLRSMYSDFMLLKDQAL